MGLRGDSRWRAYGALALAVGGITWSAIFVRWAGAPGPVSAFYRVLIAAAVLIPWRLAVTPRPREHAGIDPRRARWIAFGGGVFFALDIALWNTAVMQTQAAIASLLGNLTPVFVGLLSWIVLARRPRRSFWMGVVLSLIGCLLLVSAHLDTSRTVAAGTLFGDVIAIVASVFFAAYLLATERVRVAMDTLTFNTLAILGSAVTLGTICLAFGFPLTGYPPRTWLALAGLGLISQLGAYYALVYALGHLPATVTSVSLLAQVPGTALLAMLLLGEPLSTAQIAGTAIVLAGIYIVNTMDTRRD